MSTEVYMYIFDAVLMFGVMVAFNVVHPGQIIGRKGDFSKGSMPLSGLESGSESFIVGQK